MKTFTVVVIVLVIVLIGGEALFTWLGDRLAPKRDAAIWKHLAFYIILIGILAAAVRVATR